MPRTVLSDLSTSITEAAWRHPMDLAMQVVERRGIGRTAARAALRKLQAQHWLCQVGTPRRPRYLPGLLRQVVRRYPLQGPHEDPPWLHDFAPTFDLPDAVAQWVHHAFGDLLNAAIAQSGGSNVSVSMRRTPLQVQLLVSDDGLGIFGVIGEAFGINDPVLAMLELAKGKPSSQPDRHTGWSLSCPAKLADVFDLHANNTAFQQREWLREQWQRVGWPASPRGQAQRVVARLGQFRRAALDFEGLADVGHSSAEEWFHVFGACHPKVQRVPLTTATQAAVMVIAPVRD